MRGLTLRDVGFVGGLTPASSYDADAQTYITAVETADGQALETAVKDAINAFVVGCKSDGIWSAIKASCILAGARTLAGALVPLVGTAPTNVGLASGNYNRKTGITQNASNQYLNTNRNNISDPANSKHLAVWVGTVPVGTVRGYIMNTATNTGNDSYLYHDENGTMNFKFNGTNFLNPAASRPLSVGFFGGSVSSSVLTARIYSTTYTRSYTPSSGASNNFVVPSTPGNGTRIAFYSIGEFLSLSQLENRVSTLMSAFGTAIP